MIEPSHSAVTKPSILSGKGLGDDQSFERLAARARNHPQEKFSSLAHHINRNRIEQCIGKIPKQSAPGIDGLTRDQTLSSLDWLLPPKIAKIHSKEYEASAVRRVYIPKADGKQRPQDGHSASA